MDTDRKKPKEATDIPFDSDLAENLFSQALDLEPEARNAFLLKACDNSSLRREVLSLLQYAEIEPDFLNRPVLFHPGDELLENARWFPEEIGEYRIDRILGSGGCGDVFEAHRKDDSRDAVAIKLFRPESSGRNSSRQFETEIRALESLRHPGIVQLLGAGICDLEAPSLNCKVRYLALELISGPHLDKYLQNSKVSSTDKLRTFVDLCRTVEYIHGRHILHQDLKPSNIVVKPDGCPKIIDFGIAKTQRPNAALGDEQSSSKRPLDPPRLGTLTYMSPERIRRLGSVDQRSDVYALGVILHQMLERGYFYIQETKHPSSPVDRFNSTIQSRLRQIASKAMHRDRHARHKSAAGLAEALEQLMDHLVSR